MLVVEDSSLYSEADWVNRVSVEQLISQSFIQDCDVMIDKIGECHTDLGYPLCPEEHVNMRHARHTDRKGIEGNMESQAMKRNVACVCRRNRYVRSRTLTSVFNKILSIFSNEGLYICRISTYVSHSTCKTSDSSIHCRWFYVVPTSCSYENIEI